MGQPAKRLGCQSMFESASEEKRHGENESQFHGSWQASDQNARGEARNHDESPEGLRLRREAPRPHTKAAKCQEDNKHPSQRATKKQYAPRKDLKIATGSTDQKKPLVQKHPQCE